MGEAFDSGQDVREEEIPRGYAACARRAASWRKRGTAYGGSA